VGAQGFRVMLHFLSEPDVQGVAVCDVTQSAANYPQWDTQEFCKSVRNCSASIPVGIGLAPTSRFS